MKEKTVALLVFNGVDELDLAIWGVFGVWKRVYNGPNALLVVSQDGKPVTCANGMKLGAHHSFQNLPKTNYLIVPGGQGTRHEDKNQELLLFVKKQFLSCENILSVCTGSFLLAAAGILENKESTTHWLSLTRLKEEYPKTAVVQKRIVTAGKIMMSSGMTAGIDLGLEFISRAAKEEVAARIQRHMEYFPCHVYGKISEHAMYLGYLTQVENHHKPSSLVVAGMFCEKNRPDVNNEKLLLQSNL